MRTMRMILLASLALLTGCMASAGDGEKPAMHEALTVTLGIENAAGESTTKFRRGDTVHFTFRVHNADAAPRTLDFTFPPHRLRAYTMDAETPVWQAFEGRMFPQVMRAQEIPPGDSITFTAEWELHNVMAGDYRIEPEFIAPGSPLERDLSAVFIHID